MTRLRTLAKNPPFEKNMPESFYLKCGVPEVSILSQEIVSYLAINEIGKL